MALVLLIMSGVKPTAGPGHGFKNVSAMSPTCQPYMPPQYALRRSCWQLRDPRWDGDSPGQ